MRRHRVYDMRQCGGAVVVVLLAAALVAGCGGGSELTAPGPEPAVQSSPFYFVADIATGEVTALPPGETPPGVVSPQLVGTNTGLGSALQVTSSNLSSYGGNPGWRTVNLKVTNNMPGLVGRTPSGEVTGLDLMFTWLVFKKAGGVVVEGGSLLNPDGYNPNGQLPMIHYNRTLPSGVTAKREVVFQVPFTATQIVWGVHVRTDSALPGSFPRLLTHARVTTIAGIGVSGFADGAAHQAQFYGPYGLCVDRDGAILVADRLNDAVREITPSGQVRTVPLKGVTVDGPTDVAIDEIHSTSSKQLVYVTAIGSDKIFRIVRYPSNNSTVSVTLVAGGGASDTGTTGASLAINSPYGLSCDQTGAFWLADTAKNRLYQIRPLPSADPFTATASQYRVLKNLTTIGDPDDCSVDDHGNVFVANGDTNKITRLDADGTLTDIAAGVTLSHGACVVNRPGTICYFKSSATDRVYQLRLTGANPKLAGSWTAEKMTDGGSGYQDGSGLVAEFHFLDSGMALDASGSLYLADYSNQRIRRIDRIAGE